MYQGRKKIVKEKEKQFYLLNTWNAFSSLLSHYIYIYMYVCIFNNVHFYIKFENKKKAIVFNLNYDCLINK